MAFLVGSLKIIISDVPDNVKLQVCVTLWLCDSVTVWQCDSVTDNIPTPYSSSSSSDPAGKAVGPGKPVWEGVETGHGEEYYWRPQWFPSVFPVWLGSEVSSDEILITDQLSSGCEISGQLSSPEISAKSSNQTGSQSYRFISHFSSVFSSSPLPYLSKYMVLFLTVIRKIPASYWKTRRGKKLFSSTLWTSKNIVKFLVFITITSRES